jgi:hypothetical protein
MSFHTKDEAMRSNRAERLCENSCFSIYQVYYFLILALLSRKPLPALTGMV